MDKLQHINDIYEYINSELCGDNIMEPEETDNNIEACIIFSMDVDCDTGDIDTDEFINGEILGRCCINTADDIITLGVGGEMHDRFNSALIHNIFSANIKERIDSVISKIKEEVNKGVLHNQGNIVSFENNEYCLWSDNNIPRDIYIGHINEIKNAVHEYKRSEGSLYSVVMSYTDKESTIFKVVEILKDFSVKETEIYRL